MVKEGMKKMADKPEDSKTDEVLGLTEDEVNKMTVPKLKAALGVRGLDDTGLRAVLLARLLHAIRQPAAPAGQGRGSGQGG